MTKIPPIEKIYEAYSAIADDRISLSENKAVIKSSNGAKEYTVTWNGSIYASDDSATYWQGYPGYPVIAVLMLQGKLTLDRKIATHFGGVNWTELNQKYKRDYTAAVNSIIQARQLDAVKISAAVDKAYAELKELDISVKRGKKP